MATTTVAKISRDCEQKNTITPSSDAIQALAKMSQAGVSRMMVVDEDRLVGLLSLSDLMKFIALKMELEGGDEPGFETSPQPECREGTGRSFEQNARASNKRVIEMR